MTLTTVLPDALSPLFQPIARDPDTGDPCFPTTSVSIEHHGRKSIAVHPASSRTLTLRAIWCNGSKLLGKVNPLHNYKLTDTEVPANAWFIIA